MNNQKSDCDMSLRPHHIIDIISDYGMGVTYEPSPCGHSLHLVAPKLLSDLDLRIKLVLGADDICAGCSHLLPDTRCDDVLGQLSPSPSKQAYNDVLDSRLFDHFKLNPGYVLTFRDYLGIIDQNTPGIESICTHPKENLKERLNGLLNGLNRLGIRKDGY